VFPRLVQFLRQSRELLRNKTHAFTQQKF
jgi:hypothetical protein